MNPERVPCSGFFSVADAIACWFCSFAVFTTFQSPEERGDARVLSLARTTKRFTTVDFMALSLFGLLYRVGPHFVPEFSVSEHCSGCRLWLEPLIVGGFIRLLMGRWDPHPCTPPTHVGSRTAAPASQIAAPIYAHFFYAIAGPGRARALVSSETTALLTTAESPARPPQSAASSSSSAPPMRVRGGF